MALAGVDSLDQVMEEVVTAVAVAWVMEEVLVVVLASQLGVMEAVHVGSAAAARVLEVKWAKEVAHLAGEVGGSEEDTL
jgi:hypothetical protein